MGRAGRSDGRHDAVGPARHVNAEGHAARDVDALATAGTTVAMPYRGAPLRPCGQRGIHMPFAWC